MKLIVGLGNPGPEYEKTRHNVGFMVLDQVAQSLGLKIKEKKFKSLYATGFYGGQKFMLVKPQTYMNLSGESVAAIMNYYNLDLEDLLVVSDDLDLSVGGLRLKESGSSAGQKGLKSIISHLNSQDFKRLRIGIGKDKNIPTISYVLGKIEPGTALDAAHDCVIDFIKGEDLLSLKNKYNRKGSQDVA